MHLFDEIPIATLQVIAGFIIAIIAYINHDLTVLQAFAAVGANGVGAGVLGHARNGAGRGVR
jgi:hypothetical protein